MKRWLSVLMVFCMLFTMVQPFAMAEGATVVLGAAEVAQGDTEAAIAVPVSIKNNPGLLGLKIRVTYPEVLEVQNVAFEQVFGTETDNAADKKNPVVINWGGANEVTSDAKLATINFSLKSDAQAGTYDFAVEVVEAFNDDNDWTLSVEKGQLTVIPAAEYTVIWLDGDGTELDRKTYTEGQTEPTTDKTPVKAEDGNYTYEFSGWDNGTKDGNTTTYTPNFTPVAKEKVTYTVIWLDGDGTELDRKTYAEVQTEITTDKTPVKAEDENYTYEFSGWDNGTTEGNTKTYKPEFTSTPKSVAPQPTPGGGGCYIATSVYGSYDTPEVWTLRRFRDNVLGQTWYGRLFIKAYYATSPTLVRLFGDAEWFRNFWRDRLDSLVQNLQDDGFEATPYQDKDW